MATLEVATDAPPAIASGYANGSFRVWPQGPGPLTFLPGQQGYACGLWRIVAGHDALGPTVVAEQASPITGGLRLTITFTAAGQVAYVRSLLYDLSRFEGETWTPTHRVVSDDELLLDYYVRARWNADDAQRLAVVDTDTTVVPPGDHVVYTTMTVPRLDDPGAAGWVLTERNALECALRVWSDAPGVKRLVIPDVAMPPGTTPGAPSLESIDDDLEAVGAFEQADRYEVNGWSEVKGQRRAWVDYAGKAFDLGAGHIMTRDRAGTPGRITTYDRAGTPTDGVIPYAIGGSPRTGRREGFAVLLMNSAATGVSFDWYARNYGEGEWFTW